MLNHRHRNRSFRSNSGNSLTMYMYAWCIYFDRYLFIFQSYIDRRAVQLSEKINKHNNDNNNHCWNVVWYFGARLLQQSDYFRLKCSLSISNSPSRFHCIFFFVLSACSTLGLCVSFSILLTRHFSAINSFFRCVNSLSEKLLFGIGRFERAETTRITMAAVAALHCARTY